MSFSGSSGDPARGLRSAASEATYSAYKKQRHGHPPRLTPRHNAPRFKRFRRETNAAITGSAAVMRPKCFWIVCGEVYEHAHAQT